MTGSYQWHAERAAADAVHIRRLLTDALSALDDLLRTQGAYHTAQEREMARIKKQAGMRALAGAVAS